MDVLEYIKKMQEMYGDDVITTADKLEKPPKTVVREIFEDFNARNPKADGGQLVAPSVDGSRPGYSGKYGPNIRKKKGQNLLEVTLNRDNKTYYDSFSYGDVNRTGPKPKYPNEEAALKAANKFKDSVKTLPKATGKVTPKFLEARRKRKGTISETGKKAEIRKILNKFIAEGKTSFSNEDVKNLIDKDLFDTDKNFRTAVDVVKKENAFKNLNFIVKQRDRADFFTDPFIRNKIKENYKKLKQENLAKLVFPDDPLTTSKARLNTILTDMTDKGEIERRKAGEFSEERIQEFDPSPEAEKRAKIGKRRRKKIDILGSKDYEKELYNFKKEVQENLGLEKVKKGKYDPIDMGHQSSIKQLKALKQSLRPEDLSPQFYKANQLGIQKYEGGVKTLENSLNRKFYPEQKKLYKQAQKFINAGKAVPEDLQNKIIKSNERIQIFIDDTVKKYPLLKDRVNAVTMDPINLDVKRGGNVFKQLGIGLVDQDLGKIKTGSLDDLTIKVNLAEQTLKEAIDAGLIDEKVGRQRLDKFFKVGNVDKLKNTGMMLSSNPFFDPSLMGKVIGDMGSALVAPSTMVGLNVAFGVDPTKSLDRVLLGTEAALAPAGLKALTSRLDAIKNPGVRKGIETLAGLRLPGVFTPANVLRASRFATPVGITTLIGEGLYQLGKKGYDQYQEMKDMTEQEKSDFLADQYEDLGGVFGEGA